MTNKPGLWKHPAWFFWFFGGGYSGKHVTTKAGSKDIPSRKGKVTLVSRAQALGPGVSTTEVASSMDARGGGDGVARGLWMVSFVRLVISIARLHTASTYLHPYAHTHIRTFTHRHRYPYIRPSTHTFTQTSHSYLHTYCTFIHTCIHLSIHAYIQCMPTSYSMPRTLSSTEHGAPRRQHAAR